MLASCFPGVFFTFLHASQVEDGATDAATDPRRAAPPRLRSVRTHARAVHRALPSHQLPPSVLSCANERGTDQHGPAKCSWTCGNS